MVDYVRIYYVDRKGTEQKDILAVLMVGFSIMSTSVPQGLYWSLSTDNMSLYCNWLYVVYDITHDKHTGMQLHTAYVHVHTHTHLKIFINLYRLLH